MDAMASQITSLAIVCSTFYSKRRSKKISKLRVTGLCAGNSPVTGEWPHKRPVTRKMFPFDEIIMGWYECNASRRNNCGVGISHLLQGSFYLVVFCPINDGVHRKPEYAIIRQWEKWIDAFQCPRIPIGIRGILTSYFLRIIRVLKDIWNVLSSFFISTIRV